MEKEMEKEKKRIRHDRKGLTAWLRGYPSTISSYFHAWPLMLYYVGYRFGKERNKNKNPKKTNNKNRKEKIKKERCIFPAAASNKTIAPDFYTTKSARNLTFKSKEEYNL